MHEEVTVRQPLEVLDALGMVPLVHDAAFGIEQVGMTSPHGAEDRVAAVQMGSRNFSDEELRTVCVWT